MSKLPEKGILKKHGYGFVLSDGKDKWADDSQSDNLELMAQQETSISQQPPTGTASEVEKTLKSLNGYHEDILEALRNAASHRGTGAGNTPSGSGSISEEMLRKTLQESISLTGYGDYKRSSSKSGSKENICDIQQHPSMIADNLGHSINSMMHPHHHMTNLHDDGDIPQAGPLRIRNLEDLIRQLEHHSSKHMSPSGSEDIRMSENENDRHYRLDSSACSESSQG